MTVYDYREHQLEWIPVSERLPEENGRCVVLFKSEYIEVVMFRDGRFFVRDSIPYIGFDGEKEKIMMSSKRIDITEDITHWLPLPPPVEGRVSI